MSLSSNSKREVREIVRDEMRAVLKQYVLTFFASAEGMATVAAALQTMMQVAAQEQAQAIAAAMEGEADEPEPSTGEVVDPAVDTDGNTDAQEREVPETEPDPVPEA